MVLPGNVRDPEAHGPLDRDGAPRALLPGVPVHPLHRPIPRAVPPRGAHPEMGGHPGWRRLPLLHVEGGSGGPMTEDANPRWPMTVVLILALASGVSISEALKAMPAMLAGDLVAGGGGPAPAGAARLSVLPA